MEKSYNRLIRVLNRVIENFISTKRPYLQTILIETIGVSIKARQERRILCKEKLENVIDKQKQKKK